MNCLLLFADVDRKIQNPRLEQGTHLAEVQDSEYRAII